LKSEVVLANELARITDQATILRRDKMANARSGIRVLSRDNLRLLQNVLWTLLAISIMAISGLNSYQRTAEIGVLQALGFGPFRILTMFISRAILLTLLGAAVGILLGAWVAQLQSQPLFVSTGTKFKIDWQSALTIGVVATCISALASSLPAFIAAMRHPADIIGKEG
jgi:putative ABC transport system permease protein